MAAKNIAPPASDPMAEDALIGVFLDDERDDSRGFRRSLIAAAVVHAVLLVCTIPTLYQMEAEPPEPDKPIQVVTNIRFEKPPPPPVDAPRPEPKALKVPVPDPTPDDPEPLPQPDAPLDVADVDVDTLPFLPVSPPPPPIEPAGPVRAGSGGILPPKRIDYVLPRYTELARRVREEGTVVLDTVIDKQGRVVDIKVLKSLPWGLTESAVSAVEKWRFEPSVLNGKPVEVAYVLTVSFELN